jgi:hypothetical protein
MTQNFHKAVAKTQLGVLKTYDPTKIPSGIYVDGRNVPFSELDQETLLQIVCSQCDALDRIDAHNSKTANLLSDWRHGRALPTLNHEAAFMVQSANSMFDADDVTGLESLRSAVADLSREVAETA